MRIAAYDLGSNSFHMVVVDVHIDGTFHVLVREKDMLRLGDVVTRYGRLTDEAIARAEESLSRLQKMATGVGADEHVACATSAIREAANGPEAVDRLEQASGVKIRVISGRDEARLIFTAVRASVALEPPPALCLDLGGGSLEMSVGSHGGLQWHTSLRMGVARLAAKVALSPKPTKGELARLQASILGALAPVRAEIEELEPKIVVVTSGTFNDLVRAALIRRAGSEPLSINNARVSRAELEQLHKRLVATGPEGRAATPGIDGARGDVMVQGSLLLVTAMEAFGLETAIAGEWALREGMVLDAIGHHDPADYSGEPQAVRRSSVLALARRCQWNASHSRHVASLATSLFDQTDALHRLGAQERELLEYAALLHDIGEHVSTDSHHKHTAYLIQHGGLRGFAPEEVDALAALARYHRGSEPKASHEPYNRLDSAWQARIGPLAALLRLADGLDRGHTSAVTRADVTLTAGRASITVTPSAATGAQVELWGARRKRDLFERVFRRSVEVEESAVEPAPQ